MFSIICPFCNSLGSFSPVWNEGSIPARLKHISVGHTGTYQSFALRCPNGQCGMFVNAVAQNGKLRDYWPRTVGGKEFPDVPEHIASTADEAHQCVSIGAHRGAVALARAVVEATAKNHGVVKGNLMEKIDSLAKAGVISDAMREAAHEIRFAGNEVAHGDLVEEPIAPEDAADVLELMDAMLTRVYQEPAQVARVRQKRQARKTDSV